MMLIRQISFVTFLLLEFYFFFDGFTSFGEAKVVQSFKIDLDRWLAAGQIAGYITKTRTICEQKCAANLECLSINFCMNNQSCTVNRLTRDQADSSKYVQRARCQYAEKYMTMTFSEYNQLSQSNWGSEYDWTFPLTSGGNSSTGSGAVSSCHLDIRDDGALLLWKILASPRHANYLDLFHYCVSSSGRSECQINPLNGFMLTAAAPNYIPACDTVDGPVYSIWSRNGNLSSNLASNLGNKVSRCFTIVYEMGFYYIPPPVDGFEWDTSYAENSLFAVSQGSLMCNLDRKIEFRVAVYHNNVLTVKGVDSVGCGLCSDHGF